MRALERSHSVVTAWVKGSLVGLGNAISDGSLVVYYPHMLVLPEFQGRGIGRQLMKRLMKRYRGFHQHILVAEGKAVSFYRKCGFKRAGKNRFDVGVQGQRTWIVPKPRSTTAAAPVAGCAIA